jgi:hypothetical protein
MLIFKSLLVVAVAGYLGLVAVMYFVQRGLMYFPERTHTAPGAAGFPEAEELVLHTLDGEQINVWQVAQHDAKPVVIYLHGNGGALRNRVERFRAIISDGTGLIALDYRGYGGSTGSPSEEGLIGDALTTYDLVASRYPPEQLVLWGESLGAGVAVALAAARPVGHVVLEAPFLSAVDLAARLYPYLPVRRLMKDQFRSDLRIGKVTAPVLILHGDQDTVVPIEFGERLYALVQSPKQFVRIRGGGHENLGAYGAVATAKAFFSQPEK